MGLPAIQGEISYALSPRDPFVGDNILNVTAILFNGVSGSSVSSDMAIKPRLKNTIVRMPFNAHHVNHLQTLGVLTLLFSTSVGPGGLTTPRKGRHQEREAWTVLAQKFMRASMVALEHKICFQL